MSSPVSIAIVGASGYTGEELVRICVRHPGMKVTAVTSRQLKGRTLAETLAIGGAAGAVRFEDLSASEVAKKAEVVFLALPHGVSAEIGNELRAAGKRVFDLSADFRLKDAEVYKKTYGAAHGHASLLAEAVYGLPELAGDALRGAALIACPGCYPTSVILPVQPLVAAGIVDAARPVIVDSASGVSGAGRSAAVKSLFCEVSLQPYGVLAHRHQPEMAQETGARILFTPHLVALDRGILSTIHAELAPGRTIADARACLERAYADAPFVRLLPAGRWPSIAAVERTNCCDIALGCDDTGTHLVVSSAIDNLVKGAAGQAVQCMNIRFGLDEAEALGPCRRIAQGVAS